MVNDSFIPEWKLKLLFLADFGVAGQLTDTMAKRNTVIGTPFWMAPEVIQEIGYDCQADIWSLGITALEMAEGKPPYGEIHPMRAIFMIPTKPPPSFQEPDRWSSEFIDFVQRCLVKNPEQRATSTELLQHEFIKRAPSVVILEKIIRDAREIQQTQLNNCYVSFLLEFFGAKFHGSFWQTNFGDNVNSATMVVSTNETTLRLNSNSQDATMYVEMESSNTSRTNTTTSDVESDLGTLIINDGTDDEDSDKTLKPAFMQIFEQKENMVYRIYKLNLIF